MNNKRNLIILGIIILMVIVLVVIFVTGRKTNGENVVGGNEEIENMYSQTLEDGTKLNTSGKLKETRMIDEIKIENIQLTNKDGQGALIADVTNTGSEKSETILLNIVLYNEAGEEIATLPGVISPLEPGETDQLNTTMQEDYTNIYDIKIEKK